MTPSAPYSIGSATHQGYVRESNEDALILPPPDLDPTVAHGRGLLYGVADGMGGMAGGAVASATAAEELLRSYYTREPGPDIETNLRMAAKTANEAILRHARQDPSLTGMGTTLTVAVIQNEHAVIGHVGDSRAYRVHQGQLAQVTQDHTAGQKHRLSRALGADPYETVDTQVVDFGPDDILVMCSDGLTNHVTDEEIQATALAFDAPTAAQKLVEQALARGGQDNISVVILSRAAPRVVAAPPPPARRLPLPLPVLSGLAALILVAGLVFGLPRLIGGANSGATRETPTTQVAAGGSTTPAVTTAPASTVTPTRDTRVMAKVTTQDGLKVRSGPGTDYQELGRLSWGAEVPVLARADGGTWLLVRPEAGQPGWVAGDKEFVLVTGLLDQVPVATAPASPTVPTVTPSPSAAATHTATTTPSPTSTPTETPLPTDTPTNPPPPTAPPVRLATATPRPPPTVPPTVPTTPIPVTPIPPTPSLSITLVSPTNGDTIKGLVTFNWQLGQPLPPGQRAHVWVCKGRDCDPKKGIDSGDPPRVWCPNEDEGKYGWRVSVLTESGQIVSQTAIWYFDWTRGGQCQGSSGPGGASGGIRPPP